MSYDPRFQDESDADDEYERSVIASPTLPAGYDSNSPTESDPPSNEHTPTTFTHSTANAKSPKGRITDWNTNQVADFVSSLGLPSYRDHIFDEGVTGDVLVQLSHQNLKEMGINSVGHRLTILKAVYEVKLRQNVSIEEGDYIPLSADANAPDQHATQDDVARIIHQIQLRDERIRELEKDLYTMRDDVNRLQDEQKKLREDTLPALRALKDHSQPLPTPDGMESRPNPLASPNPNQQQDQPKSGGGVAGVVRRGSKKDWMRQMVNKIPSPTLHDNSNLQPSAAAMAASDHLTSSFNSDTRGSPHFSNQPSPTSPPYNSSTSTRFPINQPSRGPPQTPSDTGGLWQHSNASTITQTMRQPPPSRPPPTSSGRSAKNDPNDPEQFMKSFRVSMEEPCHKVLPVALKKYQIQDDPSQYSLYIVHGDEERCLGMDEKPLILFKQLANDGKKPMFMLRKHATPPDGFSSVRGASDANGGPPVGGRTMMSSQARVQSHLSYSSTLPGGVY